MEKDQFRVIKIGREALYEFIYEKFIENKDRFFQVDPIEVTDSFMMDDQNNQFIFMVHQAEDTAGNYLPLPKEVNLAQLLIKMTDTTSTMFASRRYVELSLAEIIAIQES